MCVEQLSGRPIEQQNGMCSTREEKRLRLVGKVREGSQRSKTKLGRTIPVHVGAARNTKRVMVETTHEGFEGLGAG